MKKIKDFKVWDVCRADYWYVQILEILNTRPVKAKCLHSSNTDFSFCFKRMFNLRDITFVKNEPIPHWTIISCSL